MAFDPSTNYLDFFDIVRYELIGDIWLFIFLGCGLIAWYCMAKQMPFQLLILCEVTFILLIAAVTHSMGLWAFAVLAVAAISYYLINKTISRG